MSKTTIAWTDRTENPFTGCNEEGPECINCYARVASATPRLQQFEKYHGVVDDRGRWTGQINFTPKVLDDLLRIKKPQRIFMPSMSDPFHPGVKDEWLDQMMAAIALTPHLTYQLLTKRPERMLQYLTEKWQPTPAQYFEGVYIPESQNSRQTEITLACEEIIDRFNLGDTTKGELWTDNGSLKIMQWSWPLPNLMLGVTAGTQKAADERIPLLLRAPAAGRFVSVEPMLEEVDLKRYLGKFWSCPECEAGDEYQWMLPNARKEFCGNCAGDTGRDVYLKVRGRGINQIIIGGESGTNARPFHLEWARSLINQCRETGTKVFMKQVGSNAFYEGKPFKTKSRAGSDSSEWPEWARIQEFPA
jgi:protein gp37